MIEIEIPFERIQDCDHKDYMLLSRAVNYGLKLRDWCISQGLKMNTDFEWRVDSDNRRLLFKFNDNSEMHSTMFLLKFGDGNG